MTNWRESILQHFQPKISRLTLVADPDGLLIEEGMLSAIRQRGFDLIPFDDSIAFRFAYESLYRSLWDKGEKTDLVVVLRLSEQLLNKLPFDLLKAGRQLSFALHQMFPKLNYPVIAGLERQYLDAIDESYKAYDGDQLTERETKEFVLMHCFGIVPKLVKSPIDLLRILLSLHSRREVLPDILSVFLQDTLSKQTFAAWPIDQILTNREKFFRFLQDEWKVFVEAACDGSQSSKIPFDHEDVRVYIDTFFLDGSLIPLDRSACKNLPLWAHVGVKNDPKRNSLERFNRLLRKIDVEIPSPESSHRHWQNLARHWAELVVLRWELEDVIDQRNRNNWSELQLKIEDSFHDWMMVRYPSLHNMASHLDPVMLHHIPRFLSVQRKRNKLQKIALLVMDGLALDQWLLLKRNLEQQDPSWRFEEATTFAWIPSITCISRQSIFAGEPPLYFAESLHTTSKEKTHWLRFWEDQGVQRTAVELVKSLQGETDPNLELALSNPRLSVLGLVWNKVDDIMHGMMLETAGMHNQVNLWASQGHLQKLLTRLNQEGFVIYLTADHGNITAKGFGNPKEGVLAETHGERARIYERAEFRDEAAIKFPGTVVWPGHGLPQTRHILLSGKLNAFTDMHANIVCHGGIALEEVLVPFVTITKG